MTECARLFSRFLKYLDKSTIAMHLSKSLNHRMYVKNQRLRNFAQTDLYIMEKILKSCLPEFSTEPATPLIYLFNLIFS